MNGNGKGLCCIFQKNTNIPWYWSTNTGNLKVDGPTDSSGRVGARDDCASKNVGTDNMTRTTVELDDEELDHSKFWPQLPKGWVAQRKNQFRPFYFTVYRAQLYFTHY